MSFEKWNHHKTQVPSHNATHTKRIEFYLMVVKHAKYAKYEANIIIRVYKFKTIQSNVLILGSIGTIYYASNTSNTIKSVGVVLEIWVSIMSPG